jgi:hypothetical protein
VPQSPPRRACPSSSSSAAASTGELKAALSQLEAALAGTGAGAGTAAGGAGASDALAASGSGAVPALIASVKALLARQLSQLLQEDFRQLAFEVDELALSALERREGKAGGTSVEIQCTGHGRSPVRWQRHA